MKRIILGLLFSANLFSDTYYGYLYLSNDLHSKQKSNSIWDYFDFGASFSERPVSKSSDVSLPAVAFLPGAVEALNLRCADLKKYDLFDVYLNVYQNLGYEIKYATAVLQKSKPGATNLIQYSENVMSLMQASFENRTLQVFFGEARAQIAEVILDNLGRIKTSLTPKETKKCDRIISEFCVKINEWYAFEGRIDCAENVLNNKGYPYFGYGHKTMPSADFLKQGDIKNLVAIDQFCKEKKYEEAYKIVQANSGLFYGRPQDNYFKAKYLKYFYEDFTAQGIDKRYTTLPFYKHLNRLPNAEKPSYYNAPLEKEYKVKNELIASCHISQLSECTNVIINEIIVLYPQGNRAVCTYFCNNLSADHQDLAIRQAFADLSAVNGIPNFYKFNNEVAHAKLPATIKDAIHANERILIAELGFLDTKVPEVKKSVVRALNYLERSLAHDEFASSYAVLAHKIGGVLLGTGDRSILGLPDFSLKLNNHKQEIIRDHVVKFIADQLADNEDVWVSRVCDAYNQMAFGDQIEQAYLQSSLMPGPCELVLGVDTTIFGQPTNAQEKAYICNQIFKYGNACRDIIANGERVSEKAYHLDLGTQVYAFSKGENPLKYQRFTGNQVQHVLHECRTHNLAHRAQLYRESMRPEHKAMLELSERADSLSVMFAKTKNYCKSFNFNAFGHATCSYLKAPYVAAGETCCGVIEGFGQGIQSVAETALSIPEIIDSVPEKLGHLADGLERCIIRVGKFAADAVCNPAKADKDFKKFCKNIQIMSTSILQAVQKQGFRGCSREGTKFITEFLLTGELLKFAQFGCTTIEAQATSLLAEFENEVRGAESFVAIAAEGIEIKVFEVNENCFFNESHQVGKNSLKNSERALSAVNKELLTNFESPSAFIIDSGVFSKAKEAFAHTEGAMGQNGPLKQLLEAVMQGSDIHPALKGPMFELEKGLRVRICGRKSY